MRQTSIADRADFRPVRTAQIERPSFAGGRAAWMVLWASLLALSAPASGAQQARKADGNLPEFSRVLKTVERHFAADGKHRGGDLISQSEVAALLKSLEELGWKVADREAIEKLVPRDGEFLVTQLRTRSGRKFMSQIAAMPQAYDRLDRLSDLPDGKQLVRQLIAGPDGYKMLEYLTSSKGGREMGRMLSRTAKGKNFNEPTGRIYTAEQLVVRLKQSYGEAQEPAPDKHARSRAGAP